MRKFVLIVPFCVSVLAFTACSSSKDSEDPSSSRTDSVSQQAGDSSTVTTKLLEFSPEDFTVKAGTTVAWKAGDNIGHTVTTGTFSLSGNGLRSEEEPDGKVDMPLQKGKDVSFTFSEPGTYTYYCSIHKGMNGKVIVTP
ncbi:MAG: cupredoxin domain-containing protein [Longispora sp.]|nr:cupredoxin domain-containing protein [Longispora sp. (in: high G+C Gram-positive bacteria)]